MEVPRRLPFRVYWPRKPRKPRKLTQHQIRQIEASTLPGSALAERYGVSEGRINQIKTGRHKQLAPWWIEGRQANDNAKA